MLSGRRFTLLGALFVLAGLVACQGGSSTLNPQPVNRPTPTASSSPTANPSPTSSPSSTASPSPTPTATATAAGSPSPTPTAMPTVNPSASPMVTSISPTSGPVGSSVTINGSGFDETEYIEFTGNVFASGNVNSDNMIVVTVPMGAMTGPITVKTTNGTTTTGTFTVTQ